MKCDRNMPCSTCVRYNNSNCELDSDPIDRQIYNKPIFRVIKPKDLANHSTRLDAVRDITTSQPSSSRGMHKKINENVGSKKSNSPITTSENETIRFYDDEVQVLGPNDYTRQYFGPLSWFSLLSIDKKFLPFVRYVMTHKKNFKTIIEDAETYTKEIDEFRKLDSVATNNKITVNDKFADTQQGSNILFTNTMKNPKTKLLTSIMEILPSRKTISLLLDQFFLYLYPYFPLVDEFTFKQQLYEVVGKLDYYDAPVDKLDMNRRTSFALLGLLLIFMRLSSLSLSNYTPNTMPPPNIETNLFQDEFFTSRKVGFKLFQLSNSCLKQYDLSNFSEIQVLQLALFIRIHYIYAPEESDGLGGSTTRSLTINIINLAYSMGLHRDPSHLPSKFKNDSLNHLCRKIWYFILFLDNYNSILTGDPQMSGSIPYDTQLPFTREGKETISYNIQEENVIEVFIDKYKYLLSSRKLIDEFLSINEAARTQKLVDRILVLEQQQDSIEECLRAKIIHQIVFSILDTEKLNRLFEYKVYLWSLYYRLYIHYEDRGNEVLTCHYLKKIMKHGISGPLYFCVHIFSSKSSSMKTFSDFLIIPRILHMLQRSIFCASVIHLRIQYFRFGYKFREGSEVNMEAVEEQKLTKADLIDSRITLCFQFMFDWLKNISSTYYTAWRLLKVHHHTFDVMKSENFYSECDLSIKQYLLYPLSDIYLDTILDCLNPIIGEFEKVLSHVDPNSSAGNKGVYSSQSNVEENDFDSFWQDLITQKTDFQTFNDDLFFDSILDTMNDLTSANSLLAHSHSQE